MRTLECSSDDTELLLPQKPKADASKPPSDEDLKEAATVKFIVHSAALSTFFVTMGAMAGFETLMGLAVFHSFGWDAQQALRAWLPFGIVMLFAFGSVPTLLKQFSRPKLALGVVLSTAPSLLIIHWSDLATPISLTRFYIGVLGMGGLNIIGVLIQTIVSTRVPKGDQVAANSYIQFMGQFGRGVGPILASTFYDWFISLYGQPSGLSAAALFQLALVTTGLALPFSRFSTFFGEWSELSPAAAEAAKASKTGMV